MDTVLDILTARGLLDAITDPGLKTVLQQPVTLYAGFDPSSPSLQVGNLALIMALVHFQRAGHRVIALVGGGTGMIGDPSGKSSERRLLDVETVRRNAEGIQENLARFLDIEGPSPRAVIVNNYDWLGALTLLDFLRDVAKHCRMGALLGKETVRTRLASEEGMSVAECLYPLLQAYDFLTLFDRDGCLLQVGGSDQWGNITAGIDLIGKLRRATAYGLTVPLVCDRAGRKLGKTEGNAVYLSADLTSPYAFYQFFLRTEDADVGRFLRIFTLLPLEEIIALEEKVKREPEKREAQRRLAEDVTLRVHGPDGVQAARTASAILFGAPIESVRAEDLRQIFSDVPSRKLPRTQVEGRGIVEVAVASGLCVSKAEARRLIENRGLYLNNRRVEDPQTPVRPSDLIEQSVFVLRSGKKNFLLVEAIP